MRIGIVGLKHAHIASFARFVAAVPEHELVGWVEDEPKLQERIRTQFGCPIFESTAELLAQGVDVVGLGEINRERGAIILEALEHGVHVLADKPLLLSLDELRQVREVSARKGLQVGLMLTERYNPPFHRLFEVVDNGDIGEVVGFTAFRPHKLRIASRPAWMFRHHLYGGLLADLAVHDIDIMHRVCPAEAVSIRAWQSNRHYPACTDFYDNAHAVMELENGTVAWFAANWLTPEGSAVHGDCRCFVQGTIGAVEVKVDGGFNSGEIILTTATHSARSLDWQPADVNDLYRDFLSVVAGEKPPQGMLSSADAFAATELALRAQAAADAATRGVE